MVDKHSWCDMADMVDMEYYMVDKHRWCDMADTCITWWTSIACVTWLTGVFLGGQTGSGLCWTVINSIIYFTGQCCTLDKHSCCYMVDIVLHGGHCVTWKTEYGVQCYMTDCVTWWQHGCCYFL